MSDATHHPQQDEPSKASSAEKEYQQECEDNKPMSEWSSARYRKYCDEKTKDIERWLAERAIKKKEQERQTDAANHKSLQAAREETRTRRQQIIRQDDRSSRIVKTSEDNKPMSEWSSARYRTFCDEKTKDIERWFAERAIKKRKEQERQTDAANHKSLQAARGETRKRREQISRQDALRSRIVKMLHPVPARVLQVKQQNGASPTSVYQRRYP